MINKTIEDVLSKGNHLQACCSNRAIAYSSLTFDISMDFLFRVQILEPFQDLSQNCGNLRFIQGTWFQLE